MIPQGAIFLHSERETTSKNVLFRTRPRGGGVVALFFIWHCGLSPVTKREHSLTT